MNVPKHGHSPAAVVRLISKYDRENPLQMVPLVATCHKLQQIRQPIFGIHTLQKISTDDRHPPVKPIPQVLLIVKVEQRPAVIETRKQPLLRLDIVPVVVGKVPQRDVFGTSHYVVNGLTDVSRVMDKHRLLKEMRISEEINVRQNLAATLVFGIDQHDIRILDQSYEFIVAVVVYDEDFVIRIYAADTCERFLPETIGLLASNISQQNETKRSHTCEKKREYIQTINAKAKAKAKAKL